MIRQVWNRLQLLYAQGVATLVGTDKVQVRVLDGETLGNLDRIEPYGFSYRPKPGSRAHLVFPAGDRSYGVALVIGDTRYQMELVEGEVAVHDDQGQYVRLTRAGIVVDGAGKPITIQNAPHVDFNIPVVNMSGNLNVGGNIVAQGDISDHGNKSMSSMRVTYNGHTHDDPQGGSVNQPASSM